MATLQDILESAQAEPYSFDAARALLNELDGDSVDTPDTEDGNTFTHKLILVFIEKLKNIYALLQYYTKVSLNWLPEDQKNTCTESFKALLEKSIELNRLSNASNLQGYRPLDLLRMQSFSFVNVKEVERTLLPIFDNALFIYPGRKYVADLALRRSSKKPEKVCEIPDAPMQTAAEDLTLHQRLAFHDGYLFNSGISGEAVNLVVAHMGFVISDKAKTDATHKPVFITFPIRISDYVVFAEKSNSGTHSEDGLINCLRKEDFIIQLLNDLKKHHTYFSKQKIYAMVLDFHSTSEVCLDCQSKLHKLQTDWSSKGFLQTLQRIASNSEYGFDYVFPQRTPLKLIMRVSGGINHKPNNGELADHIPKAVIWREPHQDIKQYPAGVMLYLPPSQNQQENTNFVDDTDCILKNYKKDLRANYHQAFNYANQTSYNFYRLIKSTVGEELKRVQEDRATAYDQMVQRWMTDHPNITLTFSYPTAFSNTGGKAQSVRTTSPITIDDKIASKALRKVLIV